jgi:hypothetical protein
LGPSTFGWSSWKHDKHIETDRSTIRNAVNHIVNFIRVQDEEKLLKLVTGANEYYHGNVTIVANSARELLYTIEHTCRRMALIKTGVHTIAPEVIPDDSFGIAASTQQFKKMFCFPAESFNLKQQ